MSAPRSRGPRKNTWIAAALTALAMLVFPIGVWLLLPSGKSAPETAATSPRERVAPRVTPPEDDAPKAAGRVIRGFVRDADDAPVEGAMVVIEPMRGVRSVSDEDGAFQISGVATAAVTIVASKPGYRSDRVAIEPGSAGDQIEVDLRVRVQGPIVGVVRDPAGEVAGGAFVTCDLGARSLQSRTNEDGRFELSPDAEGCSATATHPSYGASDPVVLRADADNVIELRSPGGIDGVVVDESGAPVTAYLLAIEAFVPESPPDDAVPAGRTRRISDPAGAFVLENLTPGRYVLTTSAEGRPPARSDPIEVSSGQMTHHVRLVLARGARLSGTVIDGESREPIAGATVGLDALTWTGANAIPTAVTDASGAYVIEGVPEGPFSVKVSAVRYTTRIISGITTHGAKEVSEEIAINVRGEGDAATELAGIGAVLASAQTGAKVAALVEGGPAGKAGLLEGDRFLRIDGVAVDQKTVSDVVQKLRGPAGSTVSVVVGREGGASVEITIVRDVIRR